MDLIIPHLMNGELLKDIKEAEKDHTSFHLWWLGQSGFLIQWEGKHLLIDPYLSDSLTRKYENTDKPHVRMTELIIDPVHLDFINVVTSSHNHTDHLDAETLIPIIRANPDIQMVIPEANRDFVADRLEVDREFCIGLNDLETIEVNGFSFTGVPAAHEQLERDNKGYCRFMGYVIHFGNYCIFHSGDTIGHEDIITSLRKHKIDVAILPINGSDPRRKVAGNLNAKEAIQLAKSVHARLVIPCHYDMFTFNTADPLGFINEARSQLQPEKVLQCGERWSSYLL